MATEKSAEVAVPILIWQERMDESDARFGKSALKPALYFAQEEIADLRAALIDAQKFGASCVADIGKMAEGSQEQYAGYCALSLDFDLLQLALEQTQERLRQADEAIAQRDATALRVAQCAGEFARDASRSQPQGEPVANDYHDAYRGARDDLLDCAVGATAEVSEDARDAVARAIFCVIRPPNMIDADWDSGAVLGGGNAFRNQCHEAARAAISAMAPQDSAKVDAK